MVCLESRNLIWLQWGRDLKIAEIGLSPLLASTAFRLQWGRDLKIAEIGGKLYGPQGWLRASMGPRSEDRGNIVKRGQKTCLFRFNGAAI